MGDRIPAAIIPEGVPVIGNYAATYVDEEGELRGVIILSPTLAACLGAILIQIPAGAALEAAKKGLTDALSETLHEVLNIAASLFRPSQASPRIYLANVYTPRRRPPDDIVNRIRECQMIRHMGIKIPKYANGKMTVLRIA